jgi:hypothetical protein
MRFGNELSGSSSNGRTSPGNSQPIPSSAEEALLVMSERGKNYFGNWPSS